MYFSDNLIKYAKHIERGGVVEMTSEDDEGDYNTKLSAFRNESIINNFNILWKTDNDSSKI